ncbi:MAG: hypothetical protein ABI847_17995 [Anaerolineales bacterium]
MKLNLVLTISAIYMAILGLGFILVPGAIGIGAVPADATAALLAYLRVFGSTFLAIGVLNWVARNAEPSTARNAIVLANIVGFGLAALLDIWGVFSGARQLALVFAIVHLVFTLAFIWAGRASMAAKTS